MFDEEDRETGFALFLVIALAITVSIFTMGIAAGTAITQGSPAATAKKVVPVTRVYFEPGQAALPPDAAAALAPYVAAAKDKRRSISVFGFHDASGDAAANEELAKQRAFAVRDLLIGAGVPSGQIELQKPALTTGDGDAREARRVEVTLR